MKLYVGNLSFSTTDGDLNNLFAQIGRVESARIITDQDTGRSRGFGFVEMADRSEGEAAISQLNGTQYQGRTLKVNEARPQERRPSGNRNGGNRGSSRGDNGGGFRRY
ncbi:MAG: RNA-binding protein [Blastocatellia bacterium]|nr:RNA-binding protein [Blastocatellia bacterium]